MVLAVGGIKEKVLAAKRASIKEVVLPSKNEKDVAEIEQDVIGDLTISYVTQMDQVLPKLLEKKAINNPHDFLNALRLQKMNPKHQQITCACH